jgi:hypothetical protein
MTSKFTKREILESIINAVDAGILTVADGDITPADVKAFAENEIGLLDRRAIKAKERAAAKKEEADELLDVVETVLGDEFESIPDILARIEGEDLTASKVSAKLRKLVDLGKAEKGELKVKPEGGKTRTLVAYRKI